MKEFRFFHFSGFYTCPCSFHYPWFSIRQGGQRSRMCWHLWRIWFCHLFSESSQVLSFMLSYCFLSVLARMRKWEGHFLCVTSFSEYQGTLFTCKCLWVSVTFLSIIVFFFCHVIGLEIDFFRILLKHS